MQKVKYIHFVGIKGVGMTPLAIIAKEAGIKVSGSDIDEEFITDELLRKAEISPLVGFLKTHLQNPDLVITTGAHGGFNNPEVLEARKRSIKVITQGEAVGMFMKGEIFGRTFTGISVTGTHGKTTTAALIATVFKESGLDPSFAIGTGFIPLLSSSGHYGKGRYFVAEADEYMTEPSFDRTIKFMWQHPKIAVFTNIDFDHPDVYKSINETRNAFLEFANQLPKDGLLVVCGDDWEIKKLLKDYGGRYITYGFSKDNDFTIGKVRSLEGKVEFEIIRDGVELGKVKLGVFGKQNALNSTAAFIVGVEEGLSIEVVKRALLNFSGTKRRSEYIGRLNSGAMIFDDYAHHPTEIKATLKAFRENFPSSKIVCVFQPHMYSRTKSLFEQFIISFMDASTVIITDIYASLREKPDPAVSSKLLAEHLGSFHRDVVFLPKLSDVIEYINKKAYQRDTILITMGAGDVYKINSKLKIRTMGKLIIKGGKKLKGTVSVSGSKNVALKALVAACLTDEKVTIKNIPLISDFMVMANIIKELGGEIKITDHVAKIKVSKLKKDRISLDEGAKIRTSAMFLAPLLTRTGRAIIPNPGGCRIGARPIDRIIKGLRKMGVSAKYNSKDGYFYLKENIREKPQIAQYTFDKSTHTGTETLILKAVLSKGKTILKNAAQEPEIDELVDLLTKMGAKVKRVAPRTIIINGVEKLHGTSFTINPDRNEIVTFAVASIATKGDVFIKDAQKAELSDFLEKFQEIGAGFEKKKDGIRFFYKGPLKRSRVATSSFPGFMTDWQGPWVVLMTQANGESVIHETVYENRFGYVNELKRMGADIVLFNPKVESPEKLYNFSLSDNKPEYFHAVKVFGPTRLHNAVVSISDLRAGATLVIASLIAGKENVIFGTEHLDRGYENFEERLKRLGADIKRSDK